MSSRYHSVAGCAALAMTLACASAAPDLDNLARESLAQLDGEIVLPGLEQPVEVLRDPWGVAHIYAGTVDDLFFAQGFVAAQDRLWQLEIWRRVGEGRLAEIVGPEAVERDRLARLLRYRGDMAAEWSSYHPQAERIVAAFVRGVNAFIERSAANPPVEFKLTGMRPQPWTPEVPLLRMAGLPMTQNAVADLRLARLVAEVGVAEANRRDAPEPAAPLTVPQGLAVDAVPQAAIEFLRRGYAPVPEIPVLERYRDVVGRGPAGDTTGLAGSNNWVVSGRLSATGKPLLANDPHRSLSLPSLRYLVHLNGPGWNVIGAGEPALPGVAIGHNERIAWGLTIVGIDQQDVFVERVNPENRNEVRYERRWEPLTVEVDTIPVRGEGERVVELKFSRHGPIIYEDTVRHLAYAFRSVLAEPGTAGYLGSLRVDQASNWTEYLDAMNYWKVPSENMLYADVDGNIGWQAAGLTPVRCCGWLGRLPVPGSGEFAWRGFRPMHELPREHNPGRGYIATANHNIMPSGFSPPLGFSWASPRRFRRIDDVLSDSAGFTVEQFKRLQHDVHSSAAVEAVKALDGWTAADESAERARRMLLEWDASLGVESTPAAIYRAWRDTLDGRVLESTTGKALRDSLARVALTHAVARLRAEQGPDWTDWEYGDLHRTVFDHPLGAAFDLPPIPRPGDRTTVNVTGGSGASFREIIDLSNWDNSVVTSAPGQSGQPGSPHFDDLAALWAKSEYFPLLFSRVAVEANLAHRLVLRPER